MLCVLGAHLSCRALPLAASTSEQALNEGLRNSFVSKVTGFSNHNFHCSEAFILQFLVFGYVSDVSEIGDYK